MPHRPALFGTRLHFNTPDMAASHLKGNRPAVLRPTGRDKGGELGIGQPVLLKHPKQCK